MYMDIDKNNKSVVWNVDINISNNCCDTKRIYTINNISNLYLRGYYSLNNVNSIAWIGSINNNDQYLYDSLISIFTTSIGQHFEFMSNTGNNKIRYLSMGYSINSYCKDTSLVLSALQYDFSTNLINYGCLSVATGEFRGKPVNSNKQQILFVKYKYGGGIYDEINDILWSTFYNETSWINIKINGDGTEFNITHSNFNKIVEIGIECHYSITTNNQYPSIGNHNNYQIWDNQKQVFVDTGSLSFPLKTMAINQQSSDSIIVMDNFWNIYNLNITNLNYSYIGKVRSNDNQFPFDPSPFGKLWSLAG